MKQLSAKPILFPLLFLLLVVFYSCKGPAATTIVVKQKAEPVAPAGIYGSQDTSATEAVHVLRYGEVDSIQNLDPLFARNNSARRLMMLVYEGLVIHNQQGDIIPGIAKNWDISSDSLTYTFHLNTKAYYQDMDAFSSGVGRRVSASDVKFDFERMALDSVPSDAAELFMDIDGFDTYYKEQHLVLDPAKRTLKEVPGIVVPNDSTIRFQLDFKDPSFVRKLASPFAVIYPPEAVHNSDIAHVPVGTGPFQLLKEQADTLFVLVRNPKYQSPNKLDRIEIRIYPNEQKLFTALASNDIDYIPELGPAQMNALLNPDGQLLPGYINQFTLIDAGGNVTFGLYYNPDNLFRVQKERALSLLQKFSINKYINWVGKTNISYSYNQESGNTSQQVDRFAGVDTSKSISVQYQEDEPEKDFTLALSDSLSRTLSVTLIRTPVISRSVLFYTKASPRLYQDGDAPLRDNEIYRINFRRIALSRNTVHGIRLNKFAWWQDLTSVTVPKSALK